MNRPLGSNRINDFFMGKKSVSKLNEAYEMSGGKVLTPNGRNSNSFKAKDTFVQGTPKRGAYSFSSGSSKGSPSPFFGGRTGTTHNTAPRLHGTNYHINTRGTTAFTKGLGGAAIAKAGMTYAQAFVKYGPLGLGALLFLDIVLADGGLTDGTIPEHLRNPGERQEIEEKNPPFIAGQLEGVRYVVTGVIHLYDYRGSFHQERYPGPIDIYGPVGNIEVKLDAHESNPNLTAVYFIVEGKNVHGNDFVSYNSEAGHGFTGKLIGKTIVRADGQPEPEPEPEKVFSESTTNYSNIPTPKRATVDNPLPSSIRPPFPSDRTASPTPSQSFTKPKASKSSVVKQAVVDTPEGNIETNNNLNTNNSNSPAPAKQQSKLEAPSEIPEPIPIPKPSKEKTLEEVEQPEVVETPKIISDTVTRRADGTMVRTVQRMATPEEMEEYTRKVNLAKIRNERAAETNQDYQNFHDLGYSELENREPSELNKYKQEFRDKTEANQRSPFGKIDWFTIAPSRFDGTDNWKHPFSKPNEKSVEKQPQKTTNPIPVPEPDQTPTTQTSTEPVKQTPTVDDPIKDKIDKLPSKKDIALIVGGLDVVRQITNATAGGLNPLCQAHTLQPSIDRNNATTAAAQVAIVGQGQVTQTAVNAANTTLTHPTWGLQAIVTNSAYGLQKIQTFAETAWKVTRADKIMTGVTMALTIHNAMMLSNNLASTISEALNMSLNALNIRDETDTQIDIGAAVRSKINEVMSSILGAENYAALTTRIAKANRIYQASINLLDTTYSLFDSARTVAELTAEHTGKIGNALREAGAVYEDAYEEMSEKINPQNTAMRNLGSFRDSIEVVSDAFDSVTEISSNVIEIQETIGQIKTEKQELKTEIDGFIKKQKDEKDTAKTQVQVATEIADNDFDKAPEKN